MFGLVSRSEHEQTVANLKARHQKMHQRWEQAFTRGIDLIHERDELAARLEAVLTILAESNGTTVSRRKIEDAIGRATLRRSA